MTLAFLLGGLLSFALAIFFFLRGRSARSSRNFLSAIVESSGDAILSTAPDGTITTWNRGAQGIFGYEAKEMVGHKISLLVFPNHWEEFGKLLKETNLSGPSRQESVWRKKGGERIEVSLTVTPLPEGAGSGAGISIVARDVTEDKKREMALKESEERKRSILEYAFDAIVAMDSQGMIIDWNPKAEEIFGWSREEALGHRMSERIIPPQYREAHERGLKHFLSSGEGVVFDKIMELTGLRKGGEEFPVELWVSSIPSQGGYIFNAFLRDVTEKKRKETDIQERNEQLQKFHNLGMTRELEMIRLKKEVNGLLEKLGQSEKYRVPEGLK